MPLFFIWLQLVLPDDPVMLRSWIDDGCSMLYVLQMYLKGNEGNNWLLIPENSAASPSVHCIGCCFIFFFLAGTHFIYLVRMDFPRKRSVLDVFCDKCYMHYGWIEILVKLN